MSAQLLPPNVEASKMLEAALQQMDGIIAGKLITLHIFWKWLIICRTLIKRCLDSLLETWIVGPHLQHNVSRHYELTHVEAYVTP